MLSSEVVFSGFDGVRHWSRSGTRIEIGEQLAEVGRSFPRNFRQIWAGKTGAQVRPSVRRGLLPVEPS